MAGWCGGAAKHRPHPAPFDRWSVRPYGVPTANQLLLMMILCGLWFWALLRLDWLDFEDDNVRAGLWQLVVGGSNVTTSWREYCNAHHFQVAVYVLVAFFWEGKGVESSLYACVFVVAWLIDCFRCSNETLARTIDLGDRLTPQQLCVRDGYLLIPEATRVCTIVAIVLTVLAIAGGLCLLLGEPQQHTIRRLGMLPGAAIFVTSTFMYASPPPSLSAELTRSSFLFFLGLVAACCGTTVVVLWEKYLSAFHRGSCYRIAVAATVLSLLLAVAMLVSWRNVRRSNDRSLLFCFTIGWVG